MKQSAPHAIVLAGYGLNCEEETAFAFAQAGCEADIVHLADLVEAPQRLKRYQILAIPGGFSFGDHTGAGRAYANKLKNHLRDALYAFVERDTLVLGICNGFQIVQHLGLVPGALTYNMKPRYLDRWVDVVVQNDSPWFAGMSRLSMPIAHGEGRFYAESKLLKKLQNEKSIALRYTEGDICKELGFDPNPNGSIDDIAAVTACGGRVLGTMPHPERALFFTQLPHWPRLAEKYTRSGEPLPRHADGLQLFKNARQYFS